MDNTLPFDFLNQCDQRDEQTMVYLGCLVRTVALVPLSKAFFYLCNLRKNPHTSEVNQLSAVSVRVIGDLGANVCRRQQALGVVVCTLQRSVPRQGAAVALLEELRKNTNGVMILDSHMKKADFFLAFICYASMISMASFIFGCCSDHVEDESVQHPRK